MRATAAASANIAFVKYWGKRDAALNLPAAGSLSITLDGLSTTTTVTFGAGEQDALTIDGQRAGVKALDKALRVVDLVRRRAGIVAPVSIESANNFPTGAGLASSASGLAALAVASARAAGLELSDAELSALARAGSGSACRSIFGGYVEWSPGETADGADSHARCLFPAEHWDLRALVAVVSDRPKAVDSTAGMLSTGAGSPYHQPFLDQVPRDLSAARRAIADRDLPSLARVAERSCLRMHAAMMASDPPLIYLRYQSWRVIEAVRQLRRDGVPLLFTADAGPNVKVFCEPPEQQAVEQRLRELPGVKRLIVTRPGSGARVVSP